MKAFSPLQSVSSGSQNNILSIKTSNTVLYVNGFPFFLKAHSSSNIVVECFKKYDVSQENPR